MLFMYFATVVLPRTLPCRKPEANVFGKIFLKGDRDSIPVHWFTLPDSRTSRTALILSSPMTERRWLYTQYTPSSIGENLAGIPLAIVSGGTSLVTSAHALITAPLPILHVSTVALRPMKTSFPSLKPSDASRIGCPFQEQCEEDPEKTAHNQAQ